MGVFWGFVNQNLIKKIRSSTSAHLGVIQIYGITPAA